MSSANLFLANRLDYLQRVGMVPFPLQITASASLTACLPGGGSFVRITGIGRYEKYRDFSLASPANGEKVGGDRLLTEDLLIGLHGQELPIVFFLRGNLDQVSLHIGTWIPMQRETASVPLSVTSATVRECQDVLQAVLRSLYPVIELSPAQVFPHVTQPYWSDMVAADLQAGLVLGVPTIKPINPADGALPLDRLIRGMTGSRWAVMILAQPLGEGFISPLRNLVINESRLVKTPSLSMDANQLDPLAQAYVKLLEVMLTSFTQGQRTGMWRTATYLLGDHDGYHRLSSLWRSIFSGEHSLPDPIRVWKQPAAAIADLAGRWAMPDELAPRQEGYIHHVFQYQTLLTSSQLAAYIHLPQHEINGFSIRRIPDFDVAPPPQDKEEQVIALGKIMQYNHATSILYPVALQTLTRHAFVAGVTGAGKTNTVFHLLKQSLSRGIPFLILEPAKTEYRALLHDTTVGPQLRIFTLGDEQTAPFRLNPFEVLAGISVSIHIDLLKSAFTASFGMWTPLPQILEQCMHQIYEDRGWDIALNINNRLDQTANRAESFPTLSDLVAKVDEVVSRSGYGQESKGEISAALHTRINSLRLGGKGKMLDVQRSLDIQHLLEQPTVLELEGMGDDDERAFVMGLLLIRIAEYRRTRGQVTYLQHLLVVEEAHRLLANTGQKMSEHQGDARGKAVEAFTNVLSEIRAYGQGVIIADQVPTKLAPDVVKNTTLKIIHRVVAEDDRQILAGSMAMNMQQSQTLATLTIGQAVVFNEGDDAPVLVEVLPAKSELEQTTPGSAEVAQRMTKLWTTQQKEQMLLPFSNCGGVCGISALACQVARGLVEDRLFQRTYARLVLSTLEESGALDRVWSDIMACIQARRPLKSPGPTLMSCIVIRAANWYARRRGAQMSWTYTQTQTFTNLLCRLFLDKLAEKDDEKARINFQQYARQLYSRSYEPFPSCEYICRQQPPVCLYRYAAADLTLVEHFQLAWQEVSGKPAESWELCLEAGYEIIEFPYREGASDLNDRLTLPAWRASACFGQQMIEITAKKSPRRLGYDIDQLLQASLAEEK